MRKTYKRIFKIFTISGALGILGGLLAPPRKQRLVGANGPGEEQQDSPISKESHQRPETPSPAGDAPAYPTKSKTPPSKTEAKTKPAAGAKVKPKSTPSKTAAAAKPKPKSTSSKTAAAAKPKPKSTSSKTAAAAKPRPKSTSRLPDPKRKPGGDQSGGSEK